MKPATSNVTGESGTATSNDRRRERLHLQALSATASRRLRMIEPIVESTCGATSGRIDGLVQTR